MSVDPLDPHSLEERETDLDRRKVEEVGGPVLEMRGSGRGLVPLALHERRDDRAAREPGPLELLERIEAGDQSADAGRPAEHLVERQRDEIGMMTRQVEPVGGHVRSRVEQDIPAVVMRLVDPGERVMDAGEVRLRREGEQVVVDARHLGEIAREASFVDPQLGRGARHVGRLGAASTGELADAVDRVVVVEGQQEPVIPPERVCLADEPQRSGRVRREHDDVLLRRRAKELVHGGTRLLDQFRHRRRRQVGRVRVAEDLAPKHLHVLLELRLGIEAGAGVVEVDMPARVEPRELRAAQLAEQRVGRGARRALPDQRTFSLALWKRRSRKLFVTTKMLDAAIAAAAIIGLRSPAAASGTAAML